MFYYYCAIPVKLLCSKVSSVFYLTQALAYTIISMYTILCVLCVYILYTMISVASIEMLEYSIWFQKVECFSVTDESYF